jgi:class 3 adenylate cyclase
MGLKADLEAQVKATFASQWTERDGSVIPDDKSITLGNDAVKLNATVLYADMADSTSMVDSKARTYSAEVYKNFLHCAGKIIRDNEGTITAYDGDRIMAVYIGDFKNTNAVKTALKIHWAVRNIINPAKNKQYASSTAEPVKHVVGIDTSPLYIAKTGVRGANDLVWVGRAANYAAKLSALPSGTYPTYITKEVYDLMKPEAKFSGTANMWEERVWTAMGNKAIYRSSYSWALE